MRNCIKPLLQHWDVIRAQGKKSQALGRVTVHVQVGTWERGGGAFPRDLRGRFFESVSKPVTLSVELPNSVMASKSSSLCGVLIFFI